MPQGNVRRKRILFLTDIPYWEHSVGSHSRIATLIAALADDHDVAVLNLHEDAPRAGEAIAMAVGAATVFTVPDLGEDDIAETEKAERRWPWFPVDGRWLAATAMHCNDWQPDIVVVEYIRLAYLLAAVPAGVLTMLDSHDVMSQRMALFATYGRTPSITISARNEAEILRRFDIVIAISRFDIHYMRDHLKISRLLYVPHVITPVAQRVTGSADGQSLIFVAGNSEANRTGIRYFLKEIWPPLSRTYSLKVCGSICDDVLVSSTRGVEPLGHVPDLAAEYAKADMAINPVFMGGGLKIKTLEAMNAGLPCVTTAEGARGLTDAVPHALHVAEDKIGYIDALMMLAADADRRLAMGDAAKAYVQRHFSPEAGFADIRMFLDHI